MQSYQLIRSQRKTIALEISRDLDVLVRAPAGMPQSAIDAFVAKHQTWLNQNLERCARRKARHTYTPQQEDQLRARAKTELPSRVAYFSQQMGLCPTGIKITSAETRFGSCNAKNGLCFSWRLMGYPPAAIDYVIVHELAHIQHKNHGSAFYRRVAQCLPDYKEREALLRE